jgi:hypothetical protein
LAGRFIVSLTPVRSAWSNRQGRGEGQQEACPEIDPIVAHSTRETPRSGAQLDARPNWRLLDFCFAAPRGRE